MTDVESSAVNRVSAPHDYGSEIYTEAETSDDTLANLGPLRGLAGTWMGERGMDIHPVGPGSEISGEVIEGDDHVRYVETYTLEPIDAQRNGPQVFYGLRYHTHIVQPGEVEMFHDQVGYWLWEPAARRVLHTIAIPRGQVLMAGGIADPDATEFEVTATGGAQEFGILSNRFLADHFDTVSFRMRVILNPDGSWSYEEHTALRIPGRDGVVDHVDSNTLTRVGPPRPNPLATSDTGEASV